MPEWYLLLTPLAAAAILVLFRFTGCGSFGIEKATLGNKYPAEVASDTPAGYWRLQETAGTEAKNEIGPPKGEYGKATAPIPAGDAKHHSPAANPVVLELGVNQPPLLLATDPASVSLRVRGGFVKVPSTGPLNPPEFTIEALVLPEWDLTVKGKYYCVIESSSHQPVATDARKKKGYAVYAGPDDPNDPNSAYHWQVWVGTGTEFKRLTEKKPYIHPDGNNGPLVVAAPTYLGIAYDTTKAYLYIYHADRNLDHLRYELNHLPYQAAALADLFIGISGPKRALFAPFPGPDRFMYPFAGRIEEVAIYTKALGEERISSHFVAALQA